MAFVLSGKARQKIIDALYSAIKDNLRNYSLNNLVEITTVVA